MLNQLKEVVSEDQILDLIPDMDNHKTAIFPDFHSTEIKIGETILSASANLENLGCTNFLWQQQLGSFRQKKQDRQTVAGQ
jgi:penicillin G amidase